MTAIDSGFQTRAVARRSLAMTYTRAFLLDAARIEALTAAGQAA